MTLPSLPLFVRVANRPVVLVGDGEAAAAKRRLLERAGALVVGEDAGDARLAIVAIEDDVEATAAVSRLRLRGLLVNAVDRPHLCDFTVPAIVDRTPVVVAIGTDGTSAGLAAALRQRLEALLPTTLGALAQALFNYRTELRERWPEPVERRRAIAFVLAAGGRLDPLDPDSLGRIDGDWGSMEQSPAASLKRITLRSQDPDDLTLREARLLANADRVFHIRAVPPAILDRARADADRIAGPAPRDPGRGLSVEVSMA